MDHHPHADSHRSSHTPEAIKERLAKGPAISYLKEFVYGGMDGAVTTFAIVSGVAGAGLANEVILILGFANVLADGFSMAVGCFLGAKTETATLERARSHEETHVEKYPEGEREEIRQIYFAKGLRGEELENVVQAITSDKTRWVDTMLTEEWGLSLNATNPLKAGGITFLSFILIGLIPLLPFVLDWIGIGFGSYLFASSAIFTGCAFFVVGALKGRYLSKSWYASGLQALALGTLAALLAFAVGYFLKGLVP